MLYVRIRRCQGDVRRLSESPDESSHSCLDLDGDLEGASGVKWPRKLYKQDEGFTR